MRSDIIKVQSSGEGLEEVLRQTEASAKFKGLDEKAALHLRLLAEEMMGMLRAMVGEMEAEYWLEDSKRIFQLHLRTYTLMDPEKREKLLSVSSSGKNAAARGIMGKIRDIFEMASEARNVDGLYDDWRMDGDLDFLGMPMMGLSHRWSLNQYRSHLGKTGEQWDELEKSVVAKLADEVEIFIEGGKVELVVYQKY